MAKHFLINPNIAELSKEEIQSIEKQSTQLSDNLWKKKEDKAKEAIKEKCNLKYIQGRVIIKVDLEKKNQTTFSNGTVIRLERQFNNFNRRETEPVQGTVISAEYIPEGSEILISHNALHDSNKIFSYKTSSPDIQYFSIPETDCFAWTDTDGTIKPMKNFEFALRVYEPYRGNIAGIKPTLMKEVLFITTGHLANNIVHTLKAADYQVVYQGGNGKEANLIRVRHSESEDFEREEILAISHSLTERYNNGELKIGLTLSDCKTIKEYHG